MKRKQIYIIAGPNGSGKTTFARKFLPEYAACENFINADLIANGLSPFSPESAAIKAGRLLLQQIHEYLRVGKSFGFETTLSGKNYFRLLKILKSKGYSVHLFFLWLSSAQLALARIRDRVALGGHNVPKDVVLRRFDRGLKNFWTMYEPVCDSWMLFDNSGASPKLIAERSQTKLTVHESFIFGKITKTRSIG